MAYSKISWIIVCDIKIWECYIDFILPWITGILHLTKLILTLSLNPITTYHASASRVTAQTSAIIVVWISFSYWRSLYSCVQLLGREQASSPIACVCRLSREWVFSSSAVCVYGRMRMCIHSLVAISGEYHRLCKCFSFVETGAFKYRRRLLLAWHKLVERNSSQQI